METAQTPQSTLNTVSLITIATVMLGAALSYTKNMMIPLVFALFLSYFLSPLVGFFKQKKFPHWLAVTFSVLLFLGLITSFVMILRGSVIRLFDSFYLYEERLGQLTQLLAAFLAKFEISLDQQYILSKIRELPIFSYVQSAAGTALGLLVDFLLVTVFLIFLLAGKGTGEKKRPGLPTEIDAKIRAYIITKILSNAFTAICVWIIYGILGLDLSLMFAALTFVFCFVPTLGSIVATLLPLPIALIQYHEPWQVWAVVIFPTAVQIVVGNILEPKLLGRGLDLHPITILLSLMFWGLIWGVAGMFLAVPITAVLKIILDKHPITHHFSEMLAGRSPI